MNLYVKLAVRNVFRNRRRTAITLATIAFGATSIILFGGYAQNVYQMIRENTIRSQVGHLQLYRKGFSEKGVTAPFDYMITDYPELRTTLLKMDHVRSVVPRLGFSGLVSTGDTTASFVGLGVEPEGESTLSSMARIVAGQDLTSGAPRGAILGLGLAAGLGVKPGDDLTLLTTTRHGSINALVVTVRGIWESGEKAYDDRFLKLPIASAQRLLDNEGEVQSIVILLDKTEHTSLVRDRIIARVGAQGAGVEIKTWEDLALRYHQVRTLLGRMVNLLALIVSVIVVLGIANTMMMAIFERTREIGTVMALGTRPRGVLAMFVLEGLTLGVLGGVIGIVVGVMLARVISYYGIPMPPPPGSTRGFTAQILIVPEVLFRAFRLSLITAMISSLYPAWRASRLDVVEALRHV